MLKYLFLKLQVEKNGQFCLLSIFYCHYKSLLYQTVKKKKRKKNKQKLENLSLDYMFPETQFMSKWLSFAPTLCLNTHPVFRVYPVLTQ